MHPLLHLIKTIKLDAFDSKVNLPGVIYDLLAEVKVVVVYNDTVNRSRTLVAASNDLRQTIVFAFFCRIRVTKKLVTLRYENFCAFVHFVDKLKITIGKLIIAFSL